MVLIIGPEPIRTHYSQAFIFNQQEYYMLLCIRYLNCFNEIKKKICSPPIVQPMALISVPEPTQTHYSYLLLISRKTIYTYATDI